MVILLLTRVAPPLPPTFPFVVALAWLTFKAANWVKSKNSYLRLAGKAVLLGLTALVLYLAFKFVEALVG